MKRNLFQTLTRKKTYRNIVSALCCVVVFCTTYALILPAITMSTEVFCEEKEHEHTEECLISKEPLCGLKEGEVITNDKIASNTDYQADSVSHEKGNFSLQNTESGSWFSNLFGRSSNQGTSDDDRGSGSDQNSNGPSSSGYSSHTDDGSGEEESDDGEDHIASADNNPDADHEDGTNSDHTGDSDDSDPNKDQDAAETDGDADGNDTNDFHLPANSASSNDNESDGFSDNANNGNNIEEGSVHHHTDECYHSDTPVCGQKEHKHVTQCYSNPKAVETPEEWEATLPKKEELEGLTPGERLAKVAESQIGYHPSEENFKVVIDDDTGEEKKVGYTRYGDTTINLTFESGFDHLD